MRRRLLALGMLATLALFGLPAPLTGAAGATETYGELSRFGAPGTGPGQFTLSRSTHAFGVDPSENDAVYIGDEPKAGSYRIQKLTSAGTFVAQTATFTPPKADGIEGIAIDPALKRIYVLALERRVLPELEIAVAGTLYAFSTEPEGETLPAASGTNGGVLTTPAVFLAHAKPASEALAEPRGLAVDPSTHDVIVMGEALESEVEPESNPIVLQRVNSATGALGPRYSTTALERETVSSPVVSPEGNVYVTQFDEVLQVPSDFTSTEAPTRIGGVPVEPVLESEQLQLMMPDPSALQGDGLSFAPVGPRGEPGGALVAVGGIFNERAFYPGFVTFDASTGAEAGWSGGATKRSGATACVIGFQGRTYPTIAAGGEGHVFVLDSQYAQVIQFGPGGEGCPSASDGELKALVGGAPLSEEVGEGTQVTLESNLVQADATSVEWEFGEGEATPLVLAGNYQHHTEVTHTFQQPGEHVVTEVIHTDDLATPTVQASTTVKVRTGKQPPTAVISGPIDVDVGQQADFDGSASWDPNGHLGSTTIAHYEWNFGDGSTEVTETPEVQHVYAALGTYHASLVVEDSLGLKSEASIIPVTVQTPLSPPVHEEPSLGGAGLGGSSTEAGGKAPLPVTSPPAGSAAAAPIAHLASASLPVSADGVVNAVVSCSGKAGRCAGTLSLSILARVRAGHGRSVEKGLTIASASFSLVAGRQQSVQMRLSRGARAMLHRSGKVQARSTIVSRESGGTAQVAHLAVELHKYVKNLRSKRM
jgi:PKD domain